MYRHTVVFDDQLAKRIARKAKQKKLTKAAYIRDLVTLGLAQEKGKIKDSNTYQTSKKYDKVLLTAMLETAYNCSAFLGSPAMDNAKKQALLEAGSVRLSV